MSQYVDLSNIMRFKISRIERSTHEWLAGYAISKDQTFGKACPICNRYWVSLKKDYKLFYIEEEPPMHPTFTWDYAWHPKKGVVCSSKCADMWILQHLE